MWKFNWLSFLCAINDRKLIIIIVKSVNIHIHVILYKKSFLPAYAQLGMRGAIFAMVPVAALTATVTDQTKCYTSTSLRMVDPEITAMNSNGLLSSPKISTRVSKKKRLFFKQPQVFLLVLHFKYRPTPLVTAVSYFFAPAIRANNLTSVQDFFVFKQPIKKIRINSKILCLQSLSMLVPRPCRLRGKKRAMGTRMSETFVWLFDCIMSINPIYQIYYIFKSHSNSVYCCETTRLRSRLIWVACGS